METPQLRNDGQRLHRQSQSMAWRTPTAVLLLVLGITVKTTSGVPHQLPSQRVVGGQNAELGKWPSSGVLIYKTTILCGISMISETCAVTAAHCVEFRDSNLFTILVGVLNLTGPNPTKQVVKVTEIIEYPTYNGDGKNGDLALLKLEHAVIFTENVQPIRLPDPNQMFENGKMCWLNGWGRISENEKLAAPYTLQEVELPLINASECNKMYQAALNLPYTPTAITEEMICAGYPEGKKDGCQGDSGGGLLCKYDEHWLLVGIVSWGDGCAEPMKPGVYTLVSKYTIWIVENMNAKPSSELTIMTTTVKMTTNLTEQANVSTDTTTVSESTIMTTTVNVNTPITQQPKVASEPLTLSAANNQDTSSAGRRLQISAILIVGVIVWILDVV